MNGPSTPDASDALADRDELERAFRRLTVEQRAVFVLHHYLGLPLVEVAELLELPAGTARSRLHYAIAGLRDALAAEPGARSPGRTARMIDDRTLERAARSWIEAGPSRAPDQVVEHALHLIATTPQERDLRVPRRITMPTIARVAAAAVVGVLLVGGALFMFGRPDDSVGVPPPTQAAQPSRAPSAPPSPTATAAPVRPLPSSGQLSAGRYVMGMADAPVDVEFTIGNGWTSGGWYVNTNAGSISFWTVPNVYTDACDVATLPDEKIGPTFDDLVTALDDQMNTDMSTPVDVVVGGHPGVRIELSPSDGARDMCEVLYFWTYPDGEPGRAIDLNESDSEYGSKVQPVWILDIDGERVVIVAWSFTTDGAAADTIADVMDNMTLTKR
jgi:hypothetical protein